MHVAKVVEQFIQRMSAYHLLLQLQPKSLPQASKMSVGGDHLRFGPGHVELRDLYLLELQRTDSTVQIILGCHANSGATEAGRKVNDLVVVAMPAASVSHVQHLEQPAPSSLSGVAATQSSVPTAGSNRGQQGAVGFPAYRVPARAVDHPPSGIAWSGDDMGNMTPSQWYHTNVTVPSFPSYDFASFADGVDQHATTWPFSGHGPMRYAEQ